MRRSTALLITLAAVLAAIGFSLSTPSPASAIPAGCVAHGYAIDPTGPTQGTPPGGGPNAWRLTGGITLALSTGGCDGIYMSDDLDSAFHTACGWFFPERFNPQPPIDWIPASVCTGTVKVATVCSTCSMKPGDSFLWYQAAGSPYSGPRAGHIILYYA